MVMLKFKFRNKEHSIDKALAGILDLGIKQIEKDDDLIILIFGKEGTGKSKMRDLIGGYCASKLNVPFNVNNIHFDVYKYMKEALSKPKYWINSHDEARRDLNRSKSTSRRATEFTNYLSETRDNNQIHIIILPAYSDIDKYIAIWRAKLIIEVGKTKLKNGEYRRGLFRIIKSGNKKKLEYFWKNKYLKFPKTMCYLTGSFLNNDIIDETEYKNKKQQHKEVKYANLESVEQEKEEIILTPREKEVINNTKPSQIAEYGSKDYETFKNLLKRLRKTGFKGTG